MRGSVSQWVVRERHDVGPAEMTQGCAPLRSNTGCRARQPPLGYCTVIERLWAGLTVRSRIAPLPDPSGLGRRTHGIVSAGVTDVRPSSFTMRLRVRSFGGSDDGVANAVRE